jgi:glycosyltransferase involved in cell wall biosynthesis
MKIAFIIPFKYNWNSFPSTRATYETLKILGYDVTLFVKSYKPKIEYNNYDQIWLIGSGVKLTKEEFDKISIPVIAFGLSDPNLYIEDHMQNCDIYCTNDLNIYNQLNQIKPVLYNPTSCWSKHHEKLDLEKTTDILVYGIGRHKFISNRNRTVNRLRRLGFKIKVFGRGWDAHEDTRGFIKGKRLIEEINQAKIILDITNQTTALGRRIFEGSACGTPVLTRDRVDLRQLFISGHHILTYDNFNNIVTTLNYGLANPSVLQTIGMEAQKLCYKEHDISIRVKKLLKKIREVLK